MMTRLKEWGPLITLFVVAFVIAGGAIYTVESKRSAKSEPPPLPDPVLASIEHEIGGIRADIRDLKVILERGVITIPSEPNVRIAPNVEGMLTPQISRVLGLALVWSVQQGKSIDINSFNDSTHIQGSLHYLDLAIDLDVGGDRSLDLRSLGTFLITHLPSEYQVMINRRHIHVEWEEGG